jgi:hypothetical protein
MLVSFVEGCSSILEIFSVFFFLMLKKKFCRNSSHIPKLCVFYCSLEYWGRFWYFNCSIVDKSVILLDSPITVRLHWGKAKIQQGCVLMMDLFRGIYHRRIPSFVYTDYKEIIFDTHKHICP